MLQVKHFTLTYIYSTYVCRSILFSVYDPFPFQLKAM